jgi:hypothetical protein
VCVCVCVCGHIQFDDNLFQVTIELVTLNSVGICFGERCGRWSKCLRTFSPECSRVSGH